MLNKNAMVVFMVSVVSTLVVDANAADTPQRKQVIAQSKLNGVGVKATALLRRGAIKRGSEVLQRLLGANLAPDLAGAQAAVTETRRVNKGDAYLTVDETGSSGELYRGSVADAPIAVQNKRDDEDLVETARLIVENQLAPAVGIDTSELFPIKVRHQLHTSGSRSGGSVTRQLVSSEVIFGRKIAGVPVVGPGSKVFVELSPQGSLVSFKFDWSQFTPTGELAAPAPVAVILQRANTHTRATVTTVAEYDVFECGYYDGGASDGSSILQSGCLAQRVVRDADGHVLQAFEEAIPAAAVVKADARWPLAAKLSGGKATAEAPPPAGPARP